MIRRLGQLARRPISTDNPLPVVALVDGLVYCLLSVGIVAGSTSLHNRLHPTGTYTIDYADFGIGSFAFNTICYGIGAAVLSAFFTSAVHQNFMFSVRSTSRTIIGTICCVALISTLVWAFIALTAGPITDPLDLTQIVGIFGLLAASGGYRLWGFVPAEHVTLSINGGPAVPVSAEQSALAADGETFMELRLSEE